MIRSIATVSLGGNLEQKIDAVAAAGYDGLEIFDNDLVYFNLSPEQVGRRVRDAGLEVTLFQPFRDFEAMPEQFRQRNLDRAERKFDVMEQLGASLLLVCSNVSTDVVDDPQRAAADLHELAERAKRRGLRIGFEALAWGRYVHHYQQAWDIVRRADHPNLGLILDTFHTLVRRSSLDDIAGIPGEKIFLVQVADAPAIDMDMLQLSRHYRCYPGQGELPVVAMMKKIVATGYAGPVSHEIFNDNFRAASTRTTALDGMRSLLWLEEQLGVSQHRPARTAATPLVPAPTTAGVEFIEFAAFGDTAAPFRHLLQALGFKQTHKHRSKDVTLYRQGDINIVVNEENNSFARSYYLLHGVSVCAVALRVGDAGQAHDRARALLAQPFFGPIGEGELQIPAVMGVGDSLLYFVDRYGDKGRIYDVDFAADGGPPDHAGFGLTRIDHLGQAVAPTEFLSWVMYYKSILGLDFEANQDLADPFGIIVSRSLISPDRSVRIALSASQAGQTATSRFLHHYQGSGVQQIAFACADLLAAAEQVDPDVVLPIPANYYHDLAARHGLDDALLKRLQNLNVLYDRTKNGEFFHLYTRTINGIFFEIVERRNYDRYGEINSPARLASQAASSPIA
ncbi:MAG: sugar phosphate isomerase/epimerase and 4-hydroxyphenylpyruvate domain-containing protein [Pseudomonadota bacterium]|nr:sugar phosphate isomerase/epimerase and 4-hydroxyphenylpyruvate domain-containing protein [Pseudomonadota bacterium]